MEKIIKALKNKADELAEVITEVEARKKIQDTRHSLKGLKD